MKNYECLVGQRINNITVQKILKEGTAEGICLIFCHNCQKTKQVNLRGVVYGSTKTCGCGRFDKVKGPNHRLCKDLTNQKFGKLTVLRYDVNPSARPKWVCLCECGQTTSVIGKHLVHGDTKSCGCMMHIRGDGSKGWKGYNDISGKYFSTLRRNALKRGLEFQITMKDIWDKFLMQDRRCPYTGTHLVFGHGNYGNASVDRIDATKGYTKNNIQVVLRIVNTIKWDLSEKEFLTTCKKIVSFCHDRIS